MVVKEKAKVSSQMGRARMIARRQNELKLDKSVFQRCITASVLMMAPIMLLGSD